MPHFPRFVLCLPLLAVALGAAASPPPYGGLPTARSFVALADLALGARLVLAAEISDAKVLRGDLAVGVPAGMARYLVTARVTALLAGRADLPPSVTYLADIPGDPKRKLKLKGVPVLLLGDMTTRPGEFRLVGPDAQVPRTPENEARLRTILTQSVAADAPPQIVGVTRAFHVAGSLPGEGESQIFLRTADGRPVSLSVLRRPGEQPRWAVALSEIVDDSAAPPKADSLLWYRLACSLPRPLPPAATAGAAPADAAQARADYAFVMNDLGECRRG